MSNTRIEGNVIRVNRRGKHLFCFEGTGLTKQGRSELVSVEHADHRYTGELVAISPARAILQISPIAAGHGIVSASAAIAVVA